MTLFAPRPQEKQRNGLPAIERPLLLRRRGVGAWAGGARGSNLALHGGLGVQASDRVCPKKGLALRMGAA